MKNIIFACDGDNFSHAAFEFIKSQKEKELIMVTGVFFSPIDYQLMIPVSYVPVAEAYVKLEDEKMMLLEKSKTLFKEYCEVNNINYHIHDEGEGWDKNALAKETRFADLMVISGELFCSNIDDSQPNLFMQEILHISECPIMVIPEKLSPIKNILYAYDGRKESLIALKQFIYLFPHYTGLPIEIMYMKNEETDQVPDHFLIQEYCDMHFKNTKISKLHSNKSRLLSNWMEEKKDTLFVCGSFSRSFISNSWKESFSTRVIHDHSMPVFVAHSL